MEANTMETTGHDDTGALGGFLPDELALIPTDRSPVAARPGTAWGGSAGDPDFEADRIGEDAVNLWFDGEDATARVTVSVSGARRIIRALQTAVRSAPRRKENPPNGRCALLAFEAPEAGFSGGNSIDATISSSDGRVSVSTASLTPEDGLEAARLLVEVSQQAAEDRCLRARTWSNRAVVRR